MSVHYSNPQEMVNETIIFDESLEASVASPLRVAYGINQNFLFGCGVPITSALLYNNDMSFVFRALIDDIPEADTQRLPQLAKSYHTCIQIHLANCERPKALPTTKDWSIAIYFHFVIADYFIDQQDKIPYPDTDIACQGNLEPLITMDLANNAATVVAEHDANWWSLQDQSLQCNEFEKGYLNSGVLLVNTLAWAQESASAKAISMLVDRAIISRLTYMGQGILNLTLLGEVKFTDVKYNTQLSLNYELKKSLVCPTNDEIVLIHYAGPTKPWHYWVGYLSA